MAAIDEILQRVPLDQLAQQVGADPAEVEQAASQALPAILGGLQANAQDPAGSSSIINALGQHEDDLLSGDNVDLSKVSEADGQKIAANIFGDNEDQVYSALGSAGGATGDGLIRKVLPMLAPIVLSYLAGKMAGGRSGGTVAQPQQVPTPSQQGQQGSTGTPGSLDSMLQDVLGGALGGGRVQTQQTQQTQAQQPGRGGGSVLDILGGMLGSGRR